MGFAGPPRAPGAAGAPLGVGAAVLAALLLASGCGSSSQDSQDSKDYAAPKSVCGVPAPSKDLARLLPDGKKLAQDSYDAGQQSPRCRLSVDGKLVMRLSGDVVSAGTDPLKSGADGMRREGNPEPVDVGDGGVLADTGALAVTACTYHGQLRKFAVEIELSHPYPEKTADRREALLAFFRSYVPNAVKKQGCA